MRYAILSDVHANLEALEAVLRALEKEHVDRLLCAGDLVGYGADPAACLAQLRNQGAACVCGNHDYAVAGKLEPDWFNDQARAAVEWTARCLPEPEKGYLEELPLVWTDSNVTLVHGSVHEPEQFHYVMDLVNARASLDAQKTPVAFIGHTHVPRIFAQQDGKVSTLRVQQLRLDPKQKYLVNVGSVGQPRDGDPRAAYCLFDAEAQSLEIRRVPYEIARAQEKIVRNGLPRFLADRLSVGY